MKKILKIKTMRQKKERMIGFLNNEIQKYFKVIEKIQDNSLRVQGVVLKNVFSKEDGLVVISELLQRIASLDEIVDYIKTKR